VAEPAVAVILNPAAGGGKGLRMLPRVAAALRALGEPHHVHVTAAPGEATKVARRFAADGMRVVIAVGGDGTVNEVANGLIGAGGETALAVIAAGRGSDFVLNLGSPRAVEAAVERAVKGQVRRIDAARATFGDGTSRLFVNAGGLGFDAAVAERAAGSRLPGSTIPYVRGVLGALLRYRNVPVAIEADGTLVTGLACLALVANGERLGGGMKLVPGAALDDGLLDLAIVGDVGKLDLLRNLPGIYRGKHVDHPKFTHLTARRIRIECERPTRVQLDGELIGESPVTFSVEPGALLVAG
jgi:diacylglycerol kinase (ATP)